VIENLKCLTIIAGAFAFASCAGEYNERPAAGYVPDARTATRIAEAVWIPIYGEKEIRSQRPFDAEFRDAVWLVYGTLHDPHPRPGWTMVGGTAEAEIDRRSGKIIRVLHSE
jgi:hypothetical protein